MTKSEHEFLGLPDDIARIGLQRLMTCDVRWRTHDRIARLWQEVANLLGVVAAVAASLAAVSFVQSNGILAISLSIAVAVFVPLQNTLGASGRAATHRDAATKFELLTNDYERFIQLDLGPSMWRGEFSNLDRHRQQIDTLDQRLSAISATAPRVGFRESELSATERRAGYLVTYIQMKNVTVPLKTERPVWAN